ncbi:hypothetical protein SAP269_01880 [Spiroplasma ixodetis]|uniref:Spiroplasmavirus-related protein n=1 Tax=Spiroplasma ixodetis TaxID=2141 RepID=A0ABM8JKS3_9MOLU
MIIFLYKIGDNLLKYVIIIMKIVFAIFAKNKITIKNAKMPKIYIVNFWSIV